jgi:hypothetical protein
MRQSSIEGDRSAEPAGGVASAFRRKASARFHFRLKPEATLTLV